MNASEALALTEKSLPVVKEAEEKDRAAQQERERVKFKEERAQFEAFVDARYRSIVESIRSAALRGKHSTFVDFRDGPRAIHSGTIIPEPVNRILVLLKEDGFDARKSSRSYEDWHVDADGGQGESFTNYQNGYQIDWGKAK